jgi:hypothetical protein
MTFVAAFGMSLSGCSSPFEERMSEGCDSLRQVASAFDAGDREAFREATWGNSLSFDPASELADLTGEENTDVVVALEAADNLFSAARGTPKSRAASDVWPSRQLTAEEQRQLEQALAMCKDY